MRKLPWYYGAAALAVLILLSGLAYQLPPIHSRLSWRIDFAWTYMRRLVKPVKGVPTAAPVALAHALPTQLPAPEVFVTRSPAQAAQPEQSDTPAPTATRQFTPTPSPSPTPIPDRISLPSPEWEKQDINACGPAALTMYLRFYGWEGEQEVITEVIKPYREDRNVNVEELAYYVRNYAGWLNVQYRVGGDLELLKKLLAAGIPVMIEESFYFEETYWANDDHWAAHYQLLTGYDDSLKVFTGQDSFYGADQKVSYDKLDEYWQTFNRVYIMVYPPELEPLVQSILGENWDPDVNRRNALETARAETQQDPKNAFAWFNLGNNLTYFEDYFEATAAFDVARDLGLPQRMLRYQFTPFIAYFHSGKMDDLMALTTYALDITPNAEEALLWQGWAFYRQGDTNQAIANFEKALSENPNYQDAQYALDYVRNNP